MFRARSTYAVHILREAVAVKDADRRFGALRDRHSKDAPVLSDGTALRERIASYRDLDWCQGWYLYCLSDCYSVGRAAALTLLGRRQEFEFSGERALARIEAGSPSLAGPAASIKRLRPFFVLAQRDQEVGLPFPHRGRHGEVRDAVQSARALVDALP